MLAVIFAVATGISIGAAVVSFICDELSEQERKKQRELQTEYDRYEQSRYSEINRMNEYKARRIDEIDHAGQSEADRLYQNQYELLRNQRKELLNYYASQAEQRIQDKRELLQEMKNTLNVVRSVKRTQTTMLRMNALDQLIRELQESIEKLYAYIQYLNKYNKRLKFYESPESAPPKPFEFLLPKEFLYKGKLVFWKKSSIQEVGKVDIEHIGDLNYSFDEFDFLNDFDDEAVIPLLAGDFDSSKFATKMSAKKGVFKNTVLNHPRIGVRAEVIKYSDKGEIELDYGQAILLRLPKRNLANPNRIPPIGAQLRVFPTKWDYALSDRYTVEVSERSSDSRMNYNFDDIPIVFPAHKWNEFEGYLEKHGLIDYEGEWKIAPYDETEIPNVRKIKLQLGTELVFAAIVKLENDKGCFEYESLLDLSYAVKPDDIFVAIDCTLNVVQDDEMEQLNTTVFENMNDLSIMVFSEFKMQYQTKLSQNGMQYFNRWSEITDKLITYLYKGKSIEAIIDSVEKEDFYDRRLDDVAYRIYFKQPEQIFAYIEKVYTESYKPNHVEFFIEMNKRDYAFIEFSSDCEYMRVYGKGVDEYFESPPSSIYIYQKNFSYAEVQQSAALHLFRVGKLANPYLQICALDSNHIHADTKPFHIDRFINERLPEDASQKEAVERVLNEQQIFMIQGPPGTGKTTVIREIITQFMMNNEYSNILVVSQANVAVDNVLKGLVQQFSKDLVRCGQADKIDDDIIHISFEKKYKAYTDKIVAKRGSNCSQDLLNRWLEIVDPKSGYNPDIGELIMKGHRIVGATCVGLAKKKIGLDRMTFDLVVIDEAGKALPAEILIPYVKAKKVLLIGDHKQLPPTVNTALLDESKIEIDDRDIYGDQLFNESFFYRMFEGAPDTNKCMLNTQYRMPAVIGSLISELFYEGEIDNGSVTKDKRPFYFEHNLNLIDMSPDKKYREDTGQSVSVTNEREAEFVSMLISDIREKVDVARARIAVITPYKGQKRVIIRTLLNKGLNLSKLRVDVNTVDAFQGDEAEIVIFCTTRAIKPTQYFSDLRRVNVALSRAKNELIIVGSKKYFHKYKEEGHILPRIATYIEQNGQIVVPEALHLISNEEAQDKYDMIPMHSILIDDEWLKTPPKREKIEKVKEYFYQYGELDKVVVVEPIYQQYRLLDKYLQYVVAEELGLTEIKVIIKGTNVK
ncbi:AAA domain-containing protein [Paenibacillus vini]|uniref:AAA domain-containing protein n=1 Tax=Paenibacillus vini TaxID=1476024 RepID=UPI0025B681CF|nr:AAA domain-containing protein [Paenibacillus vini]MDN4066654.1 AAA domain-containing protein [Paenibacillus vini]